MLCIPKKKRSALVSVHAGSLRFSVAGGFQGVIIGSDSPQWNNLDRDSRAVLVKANPLRRVYRLRLGNRELYVKVFTAGKSKSAPCGIDDSQTSQAELSHTSCCCRVFMWLVWLFKWRLFPPGRIEFERLEYARLRSIPTTRPIGWATGRGNGQIRSILITESLGETIALEQILWRKEPTGTKSLNASLEATARLIAQMHQVGIEHRDLHSGNILLKINDSPGQPLQAFITDMQNVRIRRVSGFGAAGPAAGPYRRWRLVNLATLLSGIEPLIPKDSLYGFIKSYLTAVREFQRCPSNEPHSSADTDKRRELEYRDRVMRHLAKQQWLFQRRRDRRALKNSKYAGRIRLQNHWSAWVLLSSKHPEDYSSASRCQLTPEFWRTFLADTEKLSYLEKLFPNADLLKRGGHNTVLAGEITLGSTELSVVAKHSRLRKGLRGWLQSLRQSRAVRQWYLAHALITRQLPTAWPLAAVEQRRGPFLRESIFLCERITDARNLHQVLQDAQFFDDLEFRDQLARQLGRLLGRLRRKGFSHRDCKATNIMVQRSSAQQLELRVFFVDLDGLKLRQFNRKKSSHRAIVRLAASVLAVEGLSLRDFARVFRCYLRELDLPEAYDHVLRRKLWNKLSDRALARVLGRSRRELSNGDFRKILIVKPSSLGDVVRTLPILHYLRRRYKRAQISWMVRSEFAELLKTQTELDEIIEFDRNFYAKMCKNLRSARGFIGFVRQLRARRFDLVLDLQGLFRSGFLSFCTGAKVRMGFAHAREMANLFYTNKIKIPAQPEHVVESYWRFAEALEPKKSGPSHEGNREKIRFNIPVSKVSQQSSRKKLQKEGLADKDEYIVMLAGGSEPAKRWEPAKFALLSGKLRKEHNIQIVLLGAGACEKELAEKIVRKADCRIINLTGRTSLQELITIIQGAKLVVGNDSGPLHIAAAGGVATVGLYGPTDPVVVGPYGQMDGVVQSGRDEQRRGRYSKKEEHQMSKITVDMVLKTINNKLQEVN